MATAAQIEANRKNAQKSTGPRTAEGKARSRRNAMKHGMAALQLLPEQDERAMQARVDQWNESLKPCDAWEWHMLERAAVESLRVERCWREESALRALAAQRAEVLWDDDRRLDAAELGRRLPSDPGRIKLKLEGTVQGCLWLAARWRELLASASRGKDVRARALILLGLPADAADPADPLAGAEAEVERLEGRASGVLATIDAAERDLAECGMGPEVEKAVRRVRRYESACLRRLEWNRSQIGKVFRPAPPDPRPPLPPQYRPRTEPDPAPAPTTSGPGHAPALASARAIAGANGPNPVASPGANGPNPAPARCPNGPNPGPATPAGSLRSAIFGPPAAPNRRARRAARGRAA